MTGFIFAKESSVPLPISCDQILLRSAVSMKLISGVGGVVLIWLLRCLFGHSKRYDRLAQLF